MNPKAIESKWQKKWTEAKAYESEPGGDKEKYFVNCPYPYMNGYLHLGHAFTYLRADMVSRYQRMQNKNVLFPFAFHCTCLLYTSPSPRDKRQSRMPSSA